MEGLGEPQGSEGDSGGMNLNLCGRLSFATAMCLDLGNGPAREGKVCCAAVFEGVLPVL
jgi:hypothetical protein